VIKNMPRPRPPHLHREISRHGKAVWYVRVGKDRRIRIRAEFGTTEFDAEYQAALAGERPAPRGTNAPAGSLAWLIGLYRQAPAWTSLSLATRRQRENILRQVIESAGRKPFRAITEATIAAGRDRRGRTPFQARHFLDTLRGLFEWAKEVQFVKSNLAAAVKYPLLKSGEGFPVWTEEDAATYEARWPLGTRQRVWIAVLLYTGLRRGDAVRLGRQHVRNEIINGRPGKVARLKTEKSGGKIGVTIELLPPLIEALEAGPVGELAFICGADGKRMTKESFGNAFKDACRAAGVNKSAHGLRKLAATTMANNEATNHQLNAAFGWTGNKMASLYTQAADRERLGLEASGKLMNDQRTSIPAPYQKVRAPASKG
jgi:integrase